MINSHIIRISKIRILRAKGRENSRVLEDYKGVEEFKIGASFCSKNLVMYSYSSVFSYNDYVLISYLGNYVALVQILNFDY